MNDRIEKVAMYRASDGSLHESEEQAIAAGMKDDLTKFLLTIESVCSVSMMASEILEHFNVTKKPNAKPIGGAVDKRA